MPMQPRVISCDIARCEASLIEKNYGEGWPEWLMISGLKKAGEQVCICPNHSNDIKQCLDDIEKQESIKFNIVS